MQTYPTGYAESHRIAEQIFREILPRHGMAVREEQIALCHEILDTLYGYHEHKGSSDVVRGVFIYIVSCIFLGTLLIISTIITTAEFKLKQNGCLPPHSEKHP